MRPGPRDPKAPSVAEPKAPRSSDPRTPRGAEGFGDDPHAERTDDRSTLEIRGGTVDVMVSEDEDCDVDARETAHLPEPRLTVLGADEQPLAVG